MNTVSKKIDQKILQILDKKYKSLQLPLDSIYELKQFIYGREKENYIFVINSLLLIRIYSDGELYLEGDVSVIEQLVSNPLSDIEKINKGLTKTSVIALAITGAGLLSMYSSLTPGKYETVDFCFQPEILHSKSRRDYCKSGETVFRTSPKYLAKKDSLIPNPAFLSDDVDKFLIPAKGRRITGWNKPSNPNYLWLSGISVLFTSAGYWLFSHTQDKYQLEFPKYFGNLKTYLLTNQLENQSNQEVVKATSNHRANFLVDSLISEANAKIQTFGKSYQDLASEAQLKEDMMLSESLKRSQINDLEFQNALSSLEKLNAENLKDKAKSEMEIRKYNKDEIPETEQANAEQANAEQAITNTSPEKIREIKESFSHAIQDSSKVIHPSEDLTWAILNSVMLSPLSSMIIGTTGGGKTIFETAWFHEAKKRNPQIKFYGIFQKRDYPRMLDEDDTKDRIKLFDMDNIQEFLDLFEEFYQEHLTRKPNIRMADDNGEKFSPVRFILGDWLSIHSVIDKVEPKLANILAAKMLDVVLNGRAGNCSLIADLQSFNVLAIGLKGDSNVRANLNLICLGNYSIDSYGTINDSYGVLDNILNSHHVIPEKEIRQRLKEEYKKLKPISMKNSRPILFSSLSPVTLSMVPDLMGYGGV